jgi:hypothetical protein
MIQSNAEDAHAVVAEHLVRLYLRLNGYLLLGGYLLHLPKRGAEGLRTEIDALAVRFPYQREPLHDGPDRREQKNDSGLVLPKGTKLIDFVVVEVKTGEKPRFNDPVVKDDKGAQHNIEDLLNMLGCFEEQEEIREAARRLLEQLQASRPDGPPTYALRNRRAQIRFLLFWDPAGDVKADRFFIPLSRVLKFVAERTERGGSCAPYSRWYAKWRGLDLCILKVLDELRSPSSARENRSEIEQRILRTLGKDVFCLL